MMEVDVLQGHSQKAIERAMAKGADGCDIIAACGNSFSLSAQAGEIDKFKVTSSNVLGIRVIKDHKIGISYTESLDEPAILHMSDQAIELAKFSGVDTFQEIAIKSEQDYVESNPILYQEDDTSVDDKITLALELEASVLRGEAKAKNSPYNGYGDGESLAIYLNHLGTFCAHREKAFSCYTSVLAEDKGRQAVYSDSMSGRKFSELDVSKCAQESLKHAIPLIDGKSVSTGKYDLIFSVDQLDQLFSCFSSSFSGKAAKEGKSRFKDKIGEVVASKFITLRDCPKYQDGFYYSAFDDEGVSRQDLALIEDGCLKSLYHNTATAKFFGMSTTGHAARSAKGALGVSGTHVVIDPGTASDSSVRSGQFIEVIGLKGLHSGTNPISGQFSLAIDGILYEGNEIKQYVRDVTISGNFYSLIQNVSVVGDKLVSNASQTFFAPQIRFEGVSVAG